MLQGCKRTGQLALFDLTGSFPVVSTVPRPATSFSSHDGASNPHLAAHCGGRLLITDFWVVVEKTVAQSTTIDTELQFYLHPVEFSVIPSCPDSAASTGMPVDSQQSSFLVESGEGENKMLFFRVLNKNTVMTCPQLKFTCMALIHPDSRKVTAPPVDSSEGGAGEDEGPLEIAIPPGASQGGVAEGPLKIAIFFGEGAFRWYSVVCNGCVYSLSFRPRASDMVLPPWKVLKANLSLSVTEDMEVRYVGGGGCGQDVADLIKQLLLPPLKTSYFSHESSSRARFVYTCMCMHVHGM